MTEKEEANKIANSFYEGNVFDYSKEEHFIECNKAVEKAIESLKKTLNELKTTRDSMSPVLNGYGILSLNFHISFQTGVLEEIKLLKKV